MFHFSDVRYRPEQPFDAAAIEDIAAEAFGPGRFARAAERVREMAAPDRALCFVAAHQDEIVGSVRVTPILVGEKPSLMLGPLAVRPPYKGRGAGKALMRLCADAARDKGETSIILVGDAPYYGPLGYRPVPVGTIAMPGPVDPARLLVLELRPGAAQSLVGRVRAR